jgi:hypothetical protein
MAPSTLILIPAQIVRLPSVVTIAPDEFRLTLRPPLSKTLPLTVVIAALIFTSRPQHVTIFPLVAVMAAFTLTSRNAFRVNVVVLGDAAQATA